MNSPNFKTKIGKTRMAASLGPLLLPTGMNSKESKWQAGDIPVPEKWVIEADSLFFHRFHGLFCTYPATAGKKYIDICAYTCPENYFSVTSVIFV